VWKTKVSMTEARQAATAFPNTLTVECESYSMVILVLDLRKGKNMQQNDVLRCQLDPEDEEEFTRIRERLQQLSDLIAKHGPRPLPPDPYLPLGQVVPGAPKRRQKRFEANLRKSVHCEPYYLEYWQLQARERDILSGKRARERKHAALREEKGKAALARIIRAKVGDIAIDGTFGPGLITRVNQKSLTVKRASGKSEARPPSLIKDVLTQDDLVEFFKKKDERGAIPVRAYIREALARELPIEDAVPWFKEQVRALHGVDFFPDPCVNWLYIVQCFYHEAAQQREHDELPLIPPH
jgi:hypothetical protein